MPSNTFKNALFAATLSASTMSVTAEVMVQNFWVSSTATTEPVCNGPVAYAVAYDVSKCTNVRNEQGESVQQILDSINATHYAVIEYPPASNCDTSIPSYILEIISPNGQCQKVNSGMPDLPDPLDTESVDTPNSTVATTTTSAATTTSNSTVSVTSTGASNSTPTGTSTEIASYKAAVTNATFVPDTQRSLMLSVFYTTGPLDWCGSNRNQTYTEKSYQVPIGSCFAIPPQLLNSSPVYGMGYAMSSNQSTSIAMRWYQDAQCSEALTLFFDVLGLDMCTPLPDNANSTFTAKIVNAPVNITTTTSTASPTNTPTLTAGPTSSSLTGTPSSAVPRAVSSLCSLVVCVAASVALLW